MRRFTPAAVSAVLIAAPLAAVAAAILAVPAPAPASTSGEPVPYCQPVLITTPWRQFTIHACDSGLRDPAPGKEWAWTVDGSAIKGGAVIFGAQIPKR
jgi:hypothetical protein